MNQLSYYIEKFYIKYDGLGFDYKCIIHNHLNNKDDYMKFHLFKEHYIILKPDNWKTYFTLFSVGDSFGSDFRCSLCNNEFMFEYNAKEHLTKDHNIPT